MKKVFGILFVMLLVVAVAAVAQETKYEVKSGTVVTTFNDQLVYKTPEGATKQVTIPADFKFTVDGKEMGLAELQPGMHLTAVIKTTEKPHTVKTTTIKNGEVIKVVGSNLMVKTGGQMKSITVPSGFQFIVDGQKVGLADLRPGMKLTAEIVTTKTEVIHERDVKIGGTTPTPEPAPAAEAAPAAAPAAEAAPAPALPKTGSTLPLVALLGTLCLAAGVALRRA